MSGKRLYFYLSWHKERTGFFLQIDFNIRYHHNAWGNSGLLSLFWVTLMSTSEKSTEV